VSGQREYEVTWAMIYEADSPEDAVRQALAALAVLSINPSEGPNVFFVEAPPTIMKVVYADEALAARGEGA
jgi:hypothetical protein